MAEEQYSCGRERKEGIRMAKAEKQRDGSRTHGKDENKKDEKRVC